MKAFLFLPANIRKGTAITALACCASFAFASTFRENVNVPFSLHANEAAKTYKVNITKVDDRLTIKILGPGDEKLQSFVVPISNIQGSLEDVVYPTDVDQDGFTDLEFTTGYGVGPFPNVAIYLYRPSNGFTFTEYFDQTSITKARTKGCIYGEQRYPGGYGNYYYGITSYCVQGEAWVEGSACYDYTKKVCPDCEVNKTMSCFKKRKAEIDFRRK
jgi:hypothetical protein